MVDYEFEMPIQIYGRNVATLKQAARLMREHSIEAGDYDAWEHMRLLRDIFTVSQARTAEKNLRQWSELSGARRVVCEARPVAVK